MTSYENVMSFYIRKRDWQAPLPHQQNHPEQFLNLRCVCCPVLKFEVVFQTQQLVQGGEPDFTLFFTIVVLHCSCRVQINVARMVMHGRMITVELQNYSIELGL